MNRLLVAFAALLAFSTPAAAAQKKPLTLVGAQAGVLQAGDTITVNASTSSAASINVPPGTAPASPTNGDCWSTTTGFFCRINGSTINLTQANLGSPNGTLGGANGGTGQSSYTIGDLLYASSSSALSKLAGAATGNALISGGVGTAPSWGKIGLTTHVSGTLPVANGGTGITALGTGVATALGNAVTGSGGIALATSPTLSGTLSLSTAGISTLLLDNTTSGNWKSEVQWRNNGTLKWSMGVDYAGTGNQNFYVYDAGSSAYRMFIDSAGTFTIGGSAGNLGTGEGFQYLKQSGAGFGTFAHSSAAISGNWFTAFYYNGTQIGAISQNGTTGVTYATTSDERLKKNISDAADAGAFIDSIRIRQFDWKADNSHQSYGFIAQELELVEPRAVSSPPDETMMKGVDPGALVAPLIKEVQTLRARVKALEMAATPQAANDNRQPLQLLAQGGDGEDILPARFANMRGL